MIKKLLTKLLKESLSPPENLTVSEWADKYQIVPSESAEPGRWRTERVPYMREVMNSFTQADVEKIVVKSAAQVGKSAVLLNIVGRMAHLAPCNIMIIQPTLEMAQDFSKSRLSKMIADCKELTPLFYDKARSRDPNQTILSKFYKGGRITLIGANSEAGLASRPIKILLCDEVDRYPPTTKEGDPIRLAAARTTTYFDRKLALFSTPTLKGISRIDAEYQLGTQEEWRHKCPNCGEMHTLLYEDMQIDYEEQRDEAGNKTVFVNGVAWRCPDCGFEYSERQMKNSAQAYIALNSKALINKTRSFFISGFSSPWLSWAGICKEYLESADDPSKEQTVVNTRFGKSYEQRQEVGDVDGFLNRREDYGAEVPDGVLILTAAVDVQKNRLEYEIAGWNAETRFGIIRGMIPGEPVYDSTWAELDNVLDRVYYFKDGNGIKISRTFIDSGFATDAVYKYCRENAHKGRFAIKGLGQGGIPLLHRYTYPKGSGIILTILGVDDGKSQVLSLFSKWHYPQDDSCGYGESYYRELTAERQVVRKGKLVFEKTNKDGRNESLDLATYNLACLKSCMQGDDKEFWKRRLAALRGEIKKSARTAVSRQIDIWN